MEEEKTEDVEEEKLVDSGAIPTEEISKVVDEVADRKEDPVADNIQPQKEDDIDKSSEKEAMEVEQGIFSLSLSIIWCEDENPCICLVWLWFNSPVNSFSYILGVTTSLV